MNIYKHILCIIIYVYIYIYNIYIKNFLLDNERDFIHKKKEVLIKKDAHVCIFFTRF